MRSGSGPYIITSGEKNQQRRRKGKWKNAVHVTDALQARKALWRKGSAEGGSVIKMKSIGNPNSLSTLRLPFVKETAFRRKEFF